MTRHATPFALLFLLLVSFSTGITRAHAQPPGWSEPFPPHRIIGNLYYVGTKELASFLIVTPQGNILINSDLDSTVPMIRKNIEQLGFKYSDTKILLISHAHYDHAAGSATIIQQTGAKYLVMDDDVPVIEDGGRSDFYYGKDKSSWYKPAKVDRVLHDGDVIKLGEMTLVAHKTPGHTKGCTTWTMQVKLGNHAFDVVIVGSPYVNTGYKLVNNPKYPDIVHNFEYTFDVLKSLHCDIFLGAHGQYYNLEAKYARLKKGDLTAFVDPEGYRQFVIRSEAKFQEELARQTAAAAR
ncbi:MAG: subclass B3 metallo-beta-lactamase [Edaphobacter sp.]|uniref:subclass B3 metallo-beta-lactamase n=1 Tax=Edaphobacter sp. TaxID=1934404 RepID=UPI00239AF733|nr:subclass B3 metallo-beta-lactamase [Edaphobacter sp.]MDE1175766.1 subclass B3 metallo-beta-lactamase [Edaphobacter sp.]